MSRLHLTRRALLNRLGLGLVGVAFGACRGASPAGSPTDVTSIGSPTPTVAPGLTLSVGDSTQRATNDEAGTVVPTVGGAINQRASGQIHWLVRISPGENALQQNVFEPLIHSRIPNARVNRILVAADRYVPTINSMAAGHESLELWGFGGNYMDYWARGLPQALDGFIAGDKWDVASYFVPGTSAAYNTHGHQYGLPQLTCYGSLMVYNKSKFDEAGIPYPTLDWNDASWNADALLSIATKLTKRSSAAEATYGVLVTLWDQMTSLSYLQGGDSWLPEHYRDFIAPKSSFASAANVAGHQWLQDLIYRYKVHPDPATNQLISRYADPFRTERVAMVLDGGWQYWTTSNITDFKVGIAPIPRIKANKTITFDDQWIMGRWASNKDGAWALMRLLTSVEATTKYSLLSRTPPTPRASTDAWAKARANYFGLSLDQFTKFLNQSTDQRVQESPDHLFLDHPRIDDAYTSHIPSLWSDASASAQEVIPDVAQAIDQTVRDIFNQFKDSLPKE